MSHHPRVSRTLKFLKERGWVVANDGTQERGTYPTRPDGAKLTVIGLEFVDAQWVDSEPTLYKEGKHPAPTMDPGLIDIAFHWHWRSESGEWKEDV